jgi:hypothetical protein
VSIDRVALAHEVSYVVMYKLRGCAIATEQPEQTTGIFAGLAPIRSENIASKQFKKWRVSIRIYVALVLSGCRAIARKRFPCRLVLLYCSHNLSSVPTGNTRVSTPLRISFELHSKRSTD